MDKIRSLNDRVKALELLENSGKFKDKIAYHRVIRNPENHDFEYTFRLGNDKEVIINAKNGQLRSFSEVTDNGILFEYANDNIDLQRRYGSNLDDQIIACLNEVKNG